MVQPLTRYQTIQGPFRDANGAVVFYRSVDGWRQKPPYNVATDYRMDRYLRTHSAWDGSTSATSWLYGPPPNEMHPPGRDMYVKAKNDAYGNFVNRLGEASSFGATLTAERKETFGMFVSVVSRALAAAKAVKSLRFAKAASILGLPYREKRKRFLVGYRTEVRYDPRQRRKRPMRVGVYQFKSVFDWGTGRDHLKTLANGWLMYSYGIKPLAQDCYNAMDFFQRPLPSLKVRGRAGKGESSYTQTEGWTEHAKVGVLCMAEVRVNNPNLWAMNKLGLVNPAQWLLEGIPFSFVVDWFSNLSQVVASMTDFIGLDIVNPITCERWHLSSSYLNTETGFLYWSKEWVAQRRVFGLVTPKLRFAYERFSWQRGLNAISLLVGFLKGSR